MITDAIVSTTNQHAASPLRQQRRISRTGIVGRSPAAAAARRIAAVLDGIAGAACLLHQPSAGVARAASGFNVHPVHEVITKGVDVMHVLVGQQRAARPISAVGSPARPTFGRVAKASSG